MTELMWEGKYKDGKRVAPVRILLPFQTVETVNESAQVRAHALDLWTQGQPSEWRNRLIWGDKKYVLPSLLSEFAGKVNLIYIDPPFATGADFSFTTTIPESDESFTKEPSMIEQKAYRDTWGRGLDGYLQWFYETVALLRDLLAEDGSIYVHLDTTVAHYVKAVLDEVFGHDNFVNEIVWKRYGAHNDIGQGSEHYGRVHDTIFFYRKGENTTWAQIFTPLDSAYVENTYRYTDPDTGRKFRVSPVTGPGGAAKGNPVFEWNGHTRAWRYGRETMERLHKEGRLYYSRTGYVGQKLYLDESKGTPVQDIWTDVSSLSGAHAERIGYPTQKPEPLLERILKASSNEGDLVLDCFCGSGTTAAVAEKLGLRWITCDLGRFAIHTARKRLLSIPNVKPFVVQNLGKYERQAWQVAEFAEGDKKQSPAVQLAYRRFMLDLYRAQPLDGYVWLHGVRDGRLVHVGSVDAPVAVGDVQQIVKEVWKVGAGPHPLPLSARGEGGRVAHEATMSEGGGEAYPLAPSPRERGQAQALTNGVDILGWDFAFELNEVAAQMAAEANVHLKFKRVPREVLEKKAVEQGDIKFFELAALSVAVSQKDREGVSGVRLERGPHVTVTLTDFVVPPDDVPDDVQQAVKHWSQWIDYWAVDWDYKGDAFHNMAQTYRTRKDPKLQTSLAHTYQQSGMFAVVVKVIDILGNDTTKTLKVEVR